MIRYSGFDCYERNIIIFVAGKIMKAFLARKLFYSTPCLLALAMAEICRAETLMISGWAPAAQINLKEQPPSWLGDDAVIGRLACPGIVRLEVDQGKNSPALLKAPPTVEKSGSQETWSFSLRSGLRWWSGGTIDADDLAAWLKVNLKDIVNDKLGIEIPANVEISVSNPSTVKITWPQSPKFGPYVLSGASLYRMKSGQIECAGLYAASQFPGGMDLSLSKGYTAKYAKIHITAESQPIGAGKKGILFSMAGKHSQVLRTSIKTNTCDARLDVPILTAIIWNPASPVASTPELRDALTRATPRGEILRTAAGDIGSLISGPILRSHPGYNGKFTVKPFNLDVAAQGFEKSGLKQQHIGLPRTVPGDKPATLRIARITGRQDLLEKMISDSYASIGINTQFDEVSAGGGNFDGALASVFIPWTSQDLRPVMHSSAVKSQSKEKANFPFVGVSDKDLDDMLDAYSLAITQDAPPDFELLRKVHQKWVELEPWTLLMAHQYCVDGRGIKLPKKLNSLDSDWFRDLIMK